MSNSDRCCHPLMGSYQLNRGFENKDKSVQMCTPQTPASLKGLTLTPAATIIPQNCSPNLKDLNTSQSSKYKNTQHQSNDSHKQDIWVPLSLDAFPPLGSSQEWFMEGLADLRAASSPHRDVAVHFPSGPTFSRFQPSIGSGRMGGKRLVTEEGGPWERSYVTLPKEGP